MPRRSALARGFALGALACAVACAAGARRGELEPRYVAVHNTLAAMGLAEVGPLQQGSLAEGREARVVLELEAQCTTVVAIGAEGVRDIDVTLIDPSGAPVGHDTAHEPEATVRACVETPGTYTLVVKMVAGGGGYLLSTWAGGATQHAGPSPASSAQAAALAAGTCESPIPIGAGTFTGSTAHGESENEGSCSNSGAKELVYKVDLASRQRLTVELNAHFDAVLYMRKDPCTEGDGEIACKDEQPAQKKEKIDTVLDAGSYFIFVDGYSNEGGSFSLHVAATDVPSMAEVCQKAHPLAMGATVTGGTTDSFDHVNASCADGAKGPDTAYKLDLAKRSRVRLKEYSDDFGPVVHVRKQCTDEQSEVGCSDSGGADHEGTFVGVLDPGSFGVFADAAEAAADGHFTLSAEAAPEQGTGTAGDGCGDAVPLTKGDSPVSGDTFLARDDVAGKCGGTGAADVLYRLEVQRRSRFIAHIGAQEGRHVLILSRTCADRASEIACARSLDEVLAPGVYFVAVDGETAETFGNFELEWSLKDVAAQDAACRAPPALADGAAVTGSTTGAADKYSPSCGARDDTQGAPDRVYRITLAARARVHLTLATPGWDGVLALRSSCVDPPSGAHVSARGVEISCNNNSSDDANRSVVDATLDAGTYYVVVDGHGAGQEGAFTLSYRVMR